MPMVLALESKLGPVTIQRWSEVCNSYFIRSTVNKTIGRTSTWVLGEVQECKILRKAAKKRLNVTYR